MNDAIRYWTLPLIIMIACIVIAFMGEEGRTALQYLGRGTGSGLESVSYRWLTGHFTHIGWRHLVLNIFGFITIWAIYARVLHLRIWFSFLLLCPIGISLCFSLLSPQTAYYIGLSGVLHGLLAAAVTVRLIEPLKDEGQSFIVSTKWEEIIVLLGLWVKIAYEQFLGAVPMTAAISGDDVVVNAHLYGACIGTVFAFALWNANR